MQETKQEVKFQPTEEAIRKYEIITNQLQEVIGEEDIKRVLSERDLKIYWGTATTGKPHFGYFVPIFKISDYLRAGCHVTILFADLHAFLDNMKSTWELLALRCEWYEKIIKEMLKLVGVPLEKLKFVRGTSFQLSEKYTLDMYKMSAMVTTRDTSHAGAEVVKASETPLMSSLLYPILQSLDEEYLDVDAQFGGVDQRKIFMFARNYMHRIGYKKRCHLMNPLIPGLGKPKVKENKPKKPQTRLQELKDEDQEELYKMSSSDKGGKIDFDDDVNLLKKKMNDAYSLDGEVKGNGLLAMLKYVIFRWLDSKGRPLDVPRPEKFGGPQQFATYEQAEQAFEKKELVSGDLKVAISNILVEFLAPLREFCGQNKELLSKAYPSATPELKIESNKPQEKGGKTAPAPKGKNQPKVLSPFEIDLRVGQIIDIEKHPKSDRLYVEKIEVGEEKPRTIISGLAEHYTLEELKGRKLLVMCNLKPTEIGKLGIVSEGMVVASSIEVEGKSTVKLVDVPENSVVGEKVTWSGLEKQDPEATLKPDRLKKILKLLSANEEGKALFDGKNVCTTTGGECTTPLKNSILG